MYYFHGLAIIFFLLGAAEGQLSQSSLSNVTQAFSKAKVVPDVIAAFDPSALANLVFTDSSSMQQFNVTPGELLSMQQTAMEPEFFLTSNATAAASSQTLVLALVDPDAPTPQNTSLSQFLHFLGGGFGVSASDAALSNSTAALMDFFPPTPPAGSDPHRYVLLVFNEPDNFDTNAPAFVNSSTPRNNFNLTAFANSADLGTAIAGNFFLVGPSNSTTTASGTSALPAATAPNGSATAAGTPPNVTSLSGAMNEVPVVQKFVSFTVAIMLSVMWA